MQHVAMTEPLMTGVDRGWPDGPYLCHRVYLGNLQLFAAEEGQFMSALWMFEFGAMVDR